MRFVLIAHQRTGTTVFRHLLNHHRSIFLYGEAFNPSFFDWGWYSYLLPKVIENPKALLPTNAGEHLVPYLKGLYEAKERGRKTAIGIDIKIPQAERLRSMPKAVRECDASVLHLRRRNSLAAIVSYRILADRVAKGGRAHGARPAPSEPVKLNLNWLKLRIEEFENQDRFVKYSYRESNYLELFYEDFIGEAGWQRTCVLLSGFFDLKFQVPFAPKLQKQNSSNLADLIANADEVRKQFPRFFEAETVPAPGKNKK